MGLQRHTGAHLCGVLIFLLLMVSVAACAPTRPVYIPPEWQAVPPSAPVPRASLPARPERLESRKSEAPAPIKDSVPKPSTAIRERDVSTVEAVSPPVDRKPEAQPQVLASMHLVDQARTALGQGKTDQAIALLEQAIQVDVYNGEAFMGLARAWRMKGRREKSLEFARKAEILFQDEPRKLKEVYLLEADIFTELGDSAKTTFYRQRAAEL